MNWGIGVLVFLVIWLAYRAQHAEQRARGLEAERDGVPDHWYDPHPFDCGCSSCEEERKASEERERQRVREQEGLEKKRAHEQEPMPWRSKFVLLILVALWAAGAWYYFVQPTPPPTQSTAPRDFEQPQPPLPPPPEESPEHVGVGGGACAGECKGTATATLRSALAGKAGAARGCYERALRNNPTLSGRLSINVRVGPAGQVCSAVVASDALGDPRVTSCVVEMFRSASFPPPTGGCVDAQVPMNFVLKGGAQ